MSTSIFFPSPLYLPKLELTHAVSLSHLCALAKVVCRASGSWTDRKIEICHGRELKIEAEPGDYGAVRIWMKRTSELKEARLALTVLAYGIGDLVAKASVAQTNWSRISAPRGRPSTGMALTPAERQRLFREKRGI